MPNYFFDEKTGKGKQLPEVEINLDELRERIAQILNDYIPRKSSIAVEKIATEFEILTLLFHVSQSAEQNKEAPMILKLPPRPPPPYQDDGNMGE